MQEYRPVSEMTTVEVAQEIVYLEGEKKRLNNEYEKHLESHAGDLVGDGGFTSRIIGGQLGTVDDRLKELYATLEKR